MSDFGALILFGEGSKNLNASERKYILTAINEAVKEGDYSSHIQEKVYAELWEWKDDFLCLKFTEYYNDDDREEVWKFAEEEDIDEAEEFIAAIEPKLNLNLEISAIFTDW
jgi:hypothetical protein